MARVTRGAGLDSRPRRMGLGILLGAALWTLAPSAHAQEAAAKTEAKPESSPAPAAVDEPIQRKEKIWTLNAGVDFVTDYYFRGIKRENQGFIAQPWLDVTLDLWDRKGPSIVGGDADAGEGFLDNISWTVGSWNSIHTGPTGTRGDAPGLNIDDPRGWYESDIYTSLNATFLTNWQASVIYTAYMFPNEAQAATQEIAVGIGYDDSKLLGAFSVRPNILFAVETAGGMDGEHGELGTYFQLSLEPGFRLVDSKDYPISVRFPLTLGLSVSDYYENSAGKDETFGFFDAGVVFVMPLAFMPRSLGDWELKAGVHFVTSGSHAAGLAAPAVTRGEGDAFDVVGTIGVSMSY